MEFYLNSVDPREIAAVCAEHEAQEHAAYLTKLEDWYLQDSPQTRHPGRHSGPPRPSAIALREARAALPAPAPAPEPSPAPPDPFQVKLLTRYRLPVPATFVEAGMAIRAYSRAQPSKRATLAPVSPVAEVAAPAVEAGVSFMARLEDEISLLTATNARMSADEAVAWTLPRATRQTEAARLCDLRQPTVSRLNRLRDLHEALTGRVRIGNGPYIPATPAPDADLDAVAATVAAEIKRLAR